MSERLGGLSPRYLGPDIFDAIRSLPNPRSEVVVAVTESEEV